MPEGPAAAPLREDRRHRRNNFSYRSKGKGGTCSNTSLGNGSRGLASLLLSSVNIERVAFVPGACAAPSRACRADDNSPNCTNNSALVARSAMSSRGCLRTDLRRADATLSSQTSLAATNWIQSPLAKASNRAINLLLGMAPLPGRNRLWPNRLWRSLAKPTLAKPTMAKTDFGQNRLWPKLRF